MKTKGGQWIKRGSRSTKDSSWPGSYGDYVYERKAPSSYKATVQQRKVGSAGRDIGANCKGKKGSDFKKCRHDVMKTKFGLSD